MLGLAATGASLFDVDLARKSRQDALDWRLEDVDFRKEEMRWHEEQVGWHFEEVAQRVLANRRREIDEKNEQLRSISSVAALIAGFSVVTLVDFQYSNDIPEWLLSIYAFSTSVTVCLMTFAFLTTTLMLVGTLKKFEINNDIREGIMVPQRKANTTSMAQFEKTRFIVFWESNCQDDWSRAYLAFSIGVPSFLVNFVCVAWVKFYGMVYPGIVVTVVCAFAMVFILSTSHLKWGRYLAETTTNRGAPAAASSNAFMPPSADNSGEANTSPRVASDVALVRNGGGGGGDNSVVRGSDLV